MPEANIDQDEVVEAAALIASLRRIEGGCCHDCNAPYVGADALFSIILGFKDSPRCLDCLARGLHRDAADLRRQLLDAIQRRDCYRQAWALIAPDEFMDAAPMPANSQDEALSPIAGDPARVEWDAGDLGCGELVLALRKRLQEIPAGATLKLIARDPAAPEDLPSWCRLTGHQLVQAAHPVYLIRRV